MVITAVHYMCKAHALAYTKHVLIHTLGKNGDIVYNKLSSLPLFDPSKC